MRIGWRMLDLVEKELRELDQGGALGKAQLVGYWLRVYDGEDTVVVLALHPDEATTGDRVAVCEQVSHALEDFIATSCVFVTRSEVKDGLLPYRQTELRPLDDAGVVG